MTNPYNFLVLISLALIASAVNAQTVNFAPLVSYSTGVSSRPNSIAVADVNGDGKPDVLTANNNNTAGVLLGNGDGTFQAPAAYPTGGSGNYPFNSLAVADLNSDGNLDLLICNEGNNSAGVLLGNGNGTFQVAIVYPIDVPFGSIIEGIAVADVNGDRKPDLLLSSTRDAAVVLLGNGNGTFQPMIIYATGVASHPWNIAVGDVNGDAKPDLLTANIGNDTAGVLLGNGDGTFQTATTYSCGSSPYDIAIADINGDDKPDILTANAGGSTVGILLGNGNGTFQPKSICQVNYSGVATITVADVSGDGKPDLLIGNTYGQKLAILVGNGDGTFSSTVYWLGQAKAANDVAVADVNGDGRPDMLLADEFSSNVNVLLSSTALSSRTSFPNVTTTLYPNPANTHTILSITGLPNTVAHVRATLLDATGRPVRQQTIIESQGSAQTDVSTAELAAGLYMLRIAAYSGRGELVYSLPTQRLSVR